MKKELLIKCIETRMKICFEEFERRRQKDSLAETLIQAMELKIDSLQEVLNEYKELNEELNKLKAE